MIAVDPYGEHARLNLRKFHIDVHIEDGFALTTIDQTYFNEVSSQLEGTFYFPLPPDASLSQLAMYVDGEQMPGGMAERDFARQTYETIRWTQRDPALLEWVDGSLFKMRVFPLEGRREKRIFLSYTQKLPVLYGRTGYRFPAGHSLGAVDAWSFSAKIAKGARLAVTSPSHPKMIAKLDGDDQLLTAKEQHILPNRDVVLEINDFSTAATNTPTTRWSSAIHDKQQYLMLRYRPALPISQVTQVGAESVASRPQRDWMFLVESHGARDPLLARAQIEILRGMLTQANPDDLSACPSGNACLRSFSKSPPSAPGACTLRSIPMSR